MVSDIRPEGNLMKFAYKIIIAFSGQLICIGLLLAGCSTVGAPIATISNPTPTIATQAVANISLGTAFTLVGGQEVDMQGEALKIKFQEVAEDSRCPKKVPCAWEGQARIVLAVQKTGQPENRLELNTNPDKKITSTEYSGYTITLQSLDPYPEQPGQTIPLDDYHAMLTVQKT